MVGGTAGGRERCQPAHDDAAGRRQPKGTPPAAASTGAAAAPLEQAQLHPERLQSVGAMPAADAGEARRRAAAQAELKSGLQQQVEERARLRAAELQRWEERA